MGKKFEEYNKKSVSFFGFRYDAKTFWITMACTLGVLLVLVALTLFGVGVSWYGIFFGSGFLVALALAGQLCKERGINSDYPFTLIWWVFPFALLGARIYYLAFDGGIDGILDIFEIWEGGLAVYGGIIGGAVGLIISCLISKVNIAKMTDVVVPLLSIGQAFGRIGCIFGHCCYGVEVTNRALQWFPIALKIGGSYYYATNFYEAILDFCLFIGLTMLLRKQKITGLNTFAYMVGYGLIRFVLEAFRADAQTLYIGSYPVSQLLSVILVVVGTIGICTLLLVNNRKNRKGSELSED